MKTLKCMLTAAAVCAATCAASATALTPSETTFEDWGALTDGTKYLANDGTAIGSSGSAYLWTSTYDTSSIGLWENETTDPTTFPKGTDGYDTGKGYQFISLNTEGGTLNRALNPATVTQIDAETKSVEETEVTITDDLYIDTLVKFTASEDDPTSFGDGKLAIWLGTNTVSGGYVLRARAMYISYGNDELQYEARTFDLEGVSGVQADKWYRLTVQAIGNFLTAESGGQIAGFKVYLDGTPLAATAATMDSTAIPLFEEGFNPGVGSDFAANRLLVSLDADVGSSSTLKAVGFQGTGAFDSFVCTTTNPFAAAGIDFTLNVPAGATVDLANLPSGVTYANDTFTVAEGGQFTFTFKAADGKLFADGSKTQQATINVTAAGQYTPTFANALTDSVCSITADEVKTEYLTLAAAFAAAVDGQTIVLEKDVTGTLFTGVWDDKKTVFSTGLTFELNNHKWTISAGSNERCVEVYWGNKFKFQNGSIDVASGATQTCAFYGYFEMLEFNNVALDFGNLTVGTPTASDPRANAPIISQNGSVKFSGTTTATLANDQILVLMLDRADSKYVPGTLTLDVNGTLPGDILLYSACGFEVGANTTLSGNVYTGAAAWSAFDPSLVGNSPFVAMAGVPVSATGSSKVNTRIGKLYTTLPDAVTAAAAGDTIVIFADVTDCAGLAITKNLTFENLANVKWTADAGSQQYAMLINGATVNFKGTGTWSKTAGTASLCQAGANAAATIVIENGTYIGGTESMEGSGAPSNLFTTKEGSITVNGGTFTNYRYDQARCVRGEGSDTKSVSVTINAGTFWVNDHGVGTNTAEGRLCPIDNKNGKANTTISIPSTSTATFHCYADNAAFMSQFCPSGYELALNGAGLYVVSAVQTNPLTPLPAEPTDSDVAAIIANSEWTDSAVATKITTVQEYNAFKAWADENDVNSAELVACPQAFNSYALGTTTLLEEEPAIKITTVANNEGACTLTVTVSGAESGNPIAAAEAKVAAMLKMGPSLSDMAAPDGSTHGMVNAHAGENGEYSVTATPAAGATSWFMTIAE